MFTPSTEKIKELAEKHPRVIADLTAIFDKKTNIYIDWANVLGWQRKLRWHIDARRLKQLFNSFDTVAAVRLYYGTLTGDETSEEFIKDARQLEYEVKTKPVKLMRLPIDVSSIPLNSPSILQNFIRKPLLSKFSLETVEYLNSRLKELNDQGVKYIEDRKCNFDVELGRDILTDCEQNGIENFVLWSGDSDFADPVETLLEINKKAVLFSTVRRVAHEFNTLREKGLYIFEIQKIRDFICWKKDIR